MLDLIKAYENYLTKVKKASSNTIASYMRDIRQFAEWLQNNEELEVLDASQLNIDGYLRYLESNGKSGATVSRCLASLKNFYAYLVSSGFLEKTPVTDIHVDRGEKKVPQILNGKEIELLLAQPVCVDAKGYRDKAMLEVMYATGIRVRRNLAKGRLVPIAIEQIEHDRAVGIRRTINRDPPGVETAAKSAQDFKFGAIIALQYITGNCAQGAIQKFELAHRLPNIYKKIPKRAFATIK